MKLSTLFEQAHIKCGWHTTIGLHFLVKITNPLRIIVDYFDDEGGTALITGDLYIAGFVKEIGEMHNPPWRHFCDSYEECDYVCLLDPAHYDRWKTDDKNFPFAHTRYFLSRSSLEQILGKMNNQLIKYEERKTRSLIEVSQSI